MVINETAASNRSDKDVNEGSLLPTEENEERQNPQLRSSMTTFSVYKNLIVYSFSFMLMFTALSYHRFGGHLRCHGCY